MWCFFKKNFYIALLLVFISSFFVSKFKITPNLWFVSFIFLFFTALPTLFIFFKTYKFLGFFVFLILSIFAILIESIAIRTGFPYGSFYYSGNLGPKLLNLAPPVIVLSWTPLVIGAYQSVKYLFGNKFIILKTGLALTIVDLVLDPGAYILGIWLWETPGIYYGVPFTNFMGWFLTGAIGAMIMEYFLNFQSKQNFNPYILSSLIITIVFWTGVSFFNFLWIPFGLGVVIIVLLIKTFFIAQNRQQ